ncbi:hypothetical protein ACFV06_38780, partial [Streptomyces sp. NPDC059618]|uniref:hypothetical protein n=1 Tax=Streptomyces sp. NPDC059618 TaxID=3346887 RepID=UPI0036937AF0
MLLTTGYPFADGRTLRGIGSTYLLPTWPEAKVGQFMKHTGGVTDYSARKNGPFTNGAAYCRARKAVKLPESLSSVNFGLEIYPLRGFKCAYRCITCNGDDSFPIYRYELGLSLPPKAIDHPLSRREISTCVERFLHLHVRVPKSRQPTDGETVRFPVDREMFEAGDLISAHILS